MKKLNKAIALTLALLMLLPTLLFSLSSCTEENNNGGGGNKKPGASGKTDTYTVTVVTNGGMPMANLPIYVFEYEDGEIGDLVDDGYAATNEKGVATFKLPAGGSYAASIDSSLPEGYSHEKDYYPLVKNLPPIVVTSKVIEETSLTGVKYNMGDVIRDFTVTTTDNKQFTLSEVLKEKKAVMLNFWYTECSWCITEFPLMQAAYEIYKDDLAIIALNPPDSPSQDTVIDIAQFKVSNNLTFDVAQDPNGSIKNAFGVTAYPFSVIVDRYGVIAFVEPGAIVSQRDFECIFEHFTAENYEQKLVYNKEDIVPKEKPTVSMPSSDEMSQVFDKGEIEDIEYLPYPENSSAEEIEFSWPFLTGKYGDDDVVYNGNAGKESSFAQMIINVPLKAGEALAFDYFSSTELGADILYVIVDGKDLYAISGPYSAQMTDAEKEAAKNNNTWQTCYAYVAEEDATYQLALVYQKDNSDNLGDDTVYLKNLRICGVEDIDSPAYIFRYAATKPDRYGVYQDYAPIFYNENDGYYHVDSATGPLLLANLMGYSRFSDEDYFYNMCLGTDYEARAIKYCNYASNSAYNGVCTVNRELMELLKKAAADNGDKNNENEWLKFCCYYDSYGTDTELEDPIKGLATFSAYDVVLSNKGDTDFPNSIYYNRPIMPRGLFSKFTPTVSGTYLVTSYAPGVQEGSFIDSEAWIFMADNFDNREAWYTYLNIDKNNIGMTGDLSNTYMIAYLEAGKDYYINIAYGDIYQEGTIYFRVERLGGEGSYRFSLASPSYHTSLEDSAGNLTETIAGGIKAELKDGIWREKRTDGRLGSIIYADFEGITTIFGDKPIYAAGDKMDLIKAGAFDFSLSENDLYVLNTLKKYNGDKDATRAALKAELGDAYNATYVDNVEGAQQVVVGFAVEEVLAGTYHGKGTDMSDFVLSYADKIIKAGDKITVVNEDGTGVETITVQEGDPRIGCVAVDEALSNVLWKLMDKYVFEGVEFSWLKLCYYEQYFCAATPN